MRNSHEAEEIAPEAGHLVESLRDFGYTLPSALADLIDNSLTASARNIDVTIESNGPKSHIAVIDDGTGMTLETLVEAMRMGCHGPLDRRRIEDLGRFGLGMKTASLSQGRRLTVITRPGPRRGPFVRQWDIQHIKDRGWRLLDSTSTVAAPYAERVRDMSTGTAVVIEDLDRPVFLNVANEDEHLGRTLEQVRQHLSMVFHRFLEDDVVIRLGPTPLRAWDPFLRPKSMKLDTERIPFRDQKIEVTPFILPHHSKLTDDEHHVAAGPNGWNAHQGFYIYRCHRLIVPGTWLNLQLRKEEHLKLARIRVDLPNSLDAEWHLNVMKSHVAAPASLRDDFRRIAADARRQAEAVYRLRGERQIPSDPTPQRYVWKRETIRTGVRYRIDRTHPILQSLLHCGCAHESTLEKVIMLIEQTLPVACMLQESARALEGSAGGEVPDNIDDYVALVVHTEQFLVRTGQSLKNARNNVLKTEPFVRFREAILSRLSQVTTSSDT